MALMTERMRSRGLSSAATKLVSASRRQSTNKLYDLRWSVWTKYCRVNKVRPLDPRDSELANFLAHLHASRGFSASTLAGYRSSIVTTIASVTGRSCSRLSVSPTISAVINGVKNVCPRLVSRVPRWDVFVVLKTLRSSTFEPLREISLKFLTFKALFLLALACPRRVSEIHAISGLPGDVLFNTQDGSVSLSFLPEFRAKNQDSLSFSPHLSVPSLTSILGPDDEDRFLCPVRALRAYIERTAGFRGDKRRLFISLNRLYARDIAKPTISRWIVSMVRLAYQTSLAERSVQCPIRAHELRAIGSSLALAKGVPISQILHAGYWRSETTFVSFYLRDFAARSSDGSFAISRVVASESVLSV